MDQCAYHKEETQQWKEAIAVKFKYFLINTMKKKSFSYIDESKENENSDRNSHVVTMRTVSTHMRKKLTILLEKLCYQFLREVLTTTSLKHLTNTHRVKAFKELREQAVATRAGKKGKESKDKDAAATMVLSETGEALKRATDDFWQLYDLHGQLEKNQLKAIHMSSLVIEDFQSISKPELAAVSREPIVDIGQLHERYLAEKWEQTSKTVTELLHDEVDKHRNMSDEDAITSMRR